jgi:oligopeptidase B
MNNNELNSNTLEHPTAIKRPTILQKHGHQRVDNYFWMRLTDEQKSSKNPDEQTTEVIKYLEAENTYRENYWKSIKDFENKLYEEIVGRIKQTDMSVPYKNRGFWYINRFEEGKEYVIRSRKKETLEATEEILLDGKCLIN